MAIEAVIFDFGGVILDIDYAATVRGLRELLGVELSKLYSQQQQSALFDDIETGRITEVEFFSGLQQLAGKKIATARLEQAWNAMLGGTNIARIRLVKQIAQRHRIFLLSNTNSIHKRAFDQTLAAVMGGATFDALFERAYYSHQLGLRKPDPAIFQLVMAQNGLRPETTLFIDDSEQHIVSARALGIQVCHLQGELLDLVLPL